MLGIAACGSSGGASKSQYIAKADAICAAAHAQTTPLIKEIVTAGPSLVSGGARSARRLATVVVRLHVVAARNLAELQSLPQPSGDRAAIERFLTPLAAVVVAIGHAASALGSRQAPTALALLEQAQPIAQQVTSGAQDYGLTQCESVVSALG